MSRDYFKTTSTPSTPYNFNGQSESTSSPFAKLLSVAQSLTPSILSSVWGKSTPKPPIERFPAFSRPIYREEQEEEDDEDEIERNNEMPTGSFAVDRINRREEFNYSLPTPLATSDVRSSTRKFDLSKNIQRFSMATNKNDTVKNELFSLPDVASTQQQQSNEQNLSIERFQQNNLKKRPTTLDDEGELLKKNKRMKLSSAADQSKLAPRLFSTDNTSTTNMLKSPSKIFNRIEFDRHLSSSFGVISSETRKILRELECGSSPIAAARKMALDRRGGVDESETEIRSKSTTSLPPTVSLSTPYKARVLPRLATLGTTPYSRPLTKSTEDKAVSADFAFDSSSTFNSKASKASWKKDESNFKSKFSARSVDLESEDGDYVDNGHLADIVLPTMSTLPAPGFLLNVGGNRRGGAVDEVSTLTSTSPSIETTLFSFAHPIVVARPSEINALSPPVSSKSSSNFSSNASFLSKSSNDWSCGTCFIKNASSLDKCAACSSSKPTPIRSSGGFPIDNSTKSLSWTCGTCFIKNSCETDKCVACSAFKPGITQADPAWTCDTCFIRNKSDAKNCLACSMPKKGDRQHENSSQSINSFNMESARKLETTSTGGAGGKNFSSGPFSSIKPSAATATSWTCSTCFIKNDNQLSTCAACSSKKAGGRSDDSTGTQIQTTTPTITKPWSCTTCFITNPANQVNCLACESAKPGCTFKSVKFGFPCEEAITAKAQPPPATIAVFRSEPSSKSVRFAEQPVSSIKVITPEVSSPTTVIFSSTPNENTLSTTTTSTSTSSSSIPISSTSISTSVAPLKFGFGSATTSTAFSTLQLIPAEATTTNTSAASNTTATTTPFKFGFADPTSQKASEVSKSTDDTKPSTTAVPSLFSSLGSSSGGILFGSTTAAAAKTDVVTTTSNSSASSTLFSMGAPLKSTSLTFPTTNSTIASVFPSSTASVFPSSTTTSSTFGLNATPFSFGMSSSSSTPSFSLKPPTTTNTNTTTTSSIFGTTTSTTTVAPFKFGFADSKAATFGFGSTTTQGGEGVKPAVQFSDQALKLFSTSSSSTDAAAAATVTSTIPNRVATFPSSFSMPAFKSNVAPPATSSMFGLPVTSAPLTFGFAPSSSSTSTSTPAFSFNPPPSSSAAAVSTTAAATLTLPPNPFSAQSTTSNMFSLMGQSSSTNKTISSQASRKILAARRKTMPRH